MSERDGYHAKAKHCREMANKALSPLDEEAWLQLAADWLTMSSMRDRTASGQSASDRFDAQERADGAHQTKNDSEH
jgi:hypothetical protein